MDNFGIKQDMLDILATNLKGSDFRVLMKLLKHLNYKNFTQIEQIEIGEALAMRKQNVNRAINRLIKVGILLKGPRVGKSCTYRLNSHFSIKS